MIGKKDVEGSLVRARHEQQREQAREREGRARLAVEEGRDDLKVA